MAVQIITDSTADISKELAAQWGVVIVPLTVHFGEQEYIDGVTLQADEFYDKLTSAANLPTTSQVRVEAFEEAFKAALDKGDEVLCITLSSDLSGTYQSATIAKAGLGRDNIYLVDSRSVTFALALMIARAVELRDAGNSAADIAAQIQALTGKLKLYAMIDTLKYLQKGGRLSAASAVVGTMLGIKPIVTILDGKVEVCHKARGNKNALEWVVAKALESKPNLALGLTFGHTNAPEQAEALMELAGDLGGRTKAICCIGSVVGTHAGPGCTGLAFFEE